MSLVSRGRSTSRSARGRKRGISSMSSNRSRSLYSYGPKQARDGPTKRGWGMPMSLSKFFDPFPERMFVLLRYSETVNLNSAAGSLARNIFRAGSIQDPNLTGVGHQPYGHDTYASIYNHYRVVKSVVKVTNSTPGANNIMGVTLTDDTGVTGVYDLAREIKPTKFIPLASSNEPHSITMTYNSEIAFPGQKQNTTALFGNSPAEEMYFDIWVQGSNPLADPGAISLVVCIEYYCELSEFKALDQS